MAKQVEDIVVRLVGEGFEALDKIKGSFRELGKVTNLAEKDILSARDSLSDFAKAAGNTEAVSKGLIDAFKGLRSQVDVNSATYRSFSTDIARLETELRGSTAAIDRQRTSLLNNAAAGRENVASLQRQVDALRQLQQETRPGSSAFLQLGKDIDTVTIKLGKLKSEAQAFNLALGQQAGATPEVLNRQIATLQKGLQAVRFDAEQFVETLRKIQLLQITQTGRTGRAGVTADFEAYRSREFTAGYADPSRLAAMPDTTAALNQELSELTKRLDNVSRGGTDYVAVSLRIADIQRQLRTELVGTAEAFRQLDIAQTGAERRAGKLADIQEYYRTQGPTAPGVGGFRDPQTGAMIAAGSRLQTGIRPGTQYDRPIGPQPVNPAFAAFESNIKQSQERITSIYDDAYVRRTQLQADYNQISIDKLLTGLDMEGQVRNAAFGRELAVFDKQLEARDRRRGRRLTGSQLAQGAGAALSGGIFGGPEGLIGGLGGLAVGGVGGAFAGAAIGAQAGMFRQQLGGTADYAASIGKLQIALRGVVGSQQAYDAAIRAAAAATRDLNIPQEEATRGLTRLSAAVIGAGGTVADSSFAFRAMSEAIKATGGNAEQVDGALLALTQVFSKGKVSAEELNQIAERLPGTFTLFAQATGKTGPELQKALEQGEVGLNDLMKFLALTGDRYRATAAGISSSSQDAGARLTVAFQAMRLEVGKALQPLGAELQGAFAAFIKDITPAVVDSAKAIAAVLSFFTTNEVAGGLAGFALQAGAVALAIKGLVAASTSLVGLKIVSWFAGAAGGAVQLQLPLAGATTKVGILNAAVTGLGTAFKALLPFAVLTFSLDIIIRNFSQLKETEAAIRKIKEDQSTFRPGLVGPVPLNTAERRFAGASRETVADVQQRNQTYIAKLRKDLVLLERQARAVSNVVPDFNPVSRGLQLFGLNPTENYEQQKKAQVELQKLKIQGVEEVLNLELGGYKTQAEIEKARLAALSNKFPSPAGEDASTKAADKARRDAEAAAAEQQHYLESFMQQQIRVADMVFQHQQDLDRQRFDLLKELTDIEAQNRINKLFGPEREAANIQEQRRQRSLDYENRILVAMNAVAAAQQKFSSAQQMAAVTAGAGLPIATGAAGLPGSISGRLDASGQNGADMPVGVDNAIKSYHDGVVKSLGTAGRNGNYIVVKFIDDLGNLLEATYSHVAAMVKVGDSVVGGQTIGTFDASGRTTGAHNSIDINSPGTNGALQRNRETAAARRSADRLVRGQVQGTGGRLPTGVAAQQRRNVTDTGDVALAGLDVKQAQGTLANLIALRDRFNAAANEEQINALTASLTTQNNELEKTIALETKRFDLVLKGYSEERIALEQKFDQARILRDAALTGVTDETQVLAINTAYERQIALLQDLYDAQTKFNNSFGAGFQTGVQQYVQSLGTMNQAAAQLTQTGLKGIEDTLFSLVTTGTANFREFAAEILKQSARMILQLTIQRVIMQIIGAISGGGASANPSAAGGDWMGAVGRMNPTSSYAMGGTFAANNIVPYAMGGAFTNSVVSKPTLFKFAQGGTMRTGLMAEAGPEAIMPLKRGADGRLGVSGGGSAPVNVTVNVDASGNGQVAGDQNQGAQLGRVIAGAVQQELIKQRRPGGLLA